VKGRHTIELGLQYEITLDDYAQSNIVSGSLGFSGSYTQDYSLTTNPNQKQLAFAITFWMGAEPKQRGQPLLWRCRYPNLVQESRI